MKNTIKVLGIIALAAVIGFSLMACPDEGGGTTTVENKTPVAADYDIGNLTQNAGSVTAVTITPKSGKSTGTVTVKYNGSTTLPQTAATYAVTFDVAAVTGWNAASGLFAGMLTIIDPNRPTPTAADYDISGERTQTADSVTGLTITPKSGKSTGTVTVKYNGSTTLPQTAGTYTVTFDVAAVTDWNAASNLSAGTLTIENIITADFTGTFAQFETWFNAQSANTASRPYNIKLTGYVDFTTLRTTLNTMLYSNSGKYVYLDLSGSSITTIPAYAFYGTASPYGCPTLTGMTIPNSVTSIGQGAFRNCANLTGVTLQNNPNFISIEQETFSGCSSLVGVTIPASVTSIKGGDSMSYTGAFADCTSLANVTIPASVTSIGNYAFTNCTSLISVTIPNSVISIGDSAFADCTSLASVTISTSAYNSIGNWAFRGCTNLTSVTMNGVTSIGQGAFGNCRSLTSITIPNSVYSIGNWAFNNCTNLTGITIPNSVTHIGYGAFSGCTSLVSITIPDSVTSIEGGNVSYEYGTFSGCTSLVSITIPDSVTSIGINAFYNCTSLVSITIPNYVTNIGQGTFFGCNGITSVTIGRGLGLTSVNNLTFGDKLTSIIVADGNAALSSSNGILYNKNKTSLLKYPAGKTDISFTIPDDVTSIGQGAFVSCSSLTSITIPSSVTSIGDRAFYNCNILRNITIKTDKVTNDINSNWGNRFPANGLVVTFEDVAFINAYGFRNCTSLTSVTIGNSVTSIAAFAFNGCTGLTSVTIPNSVTSIGDRAFDNCNNLASVTFQGTITSANFNSSSPFPGDLRAKFYATNTTNGTPGTYTRPNGNNIWTWVSAP